MTEIPETSSFFNDFKDHQELKRDFKDLGCNLGTKETRQ